MVITLQQNNTKYNLHSYKLNNLAWYDIFSGPIVVLQMNDIEQFFSLFAKKDFEGNTIVRDS